jgi:tetratricopeptide (TPR) repeat protein
MRTRNDNRFMYHFYKIVPQLRLGRPEDAKASAEQAILVAHSEGAKYIATAQKITALSWNGEHAAAAEAAERLPKEFPGPEFARRIKLTQATVYSEARDYARAEKLLRIVLDADPNDATACNALGYHLADQNRHLEEAERLIRRAIDLDRAERQRGSSSNNNDDDDEEASGEQENAAYLDSLGWVLFRKGKYAEARTWIEKAVALPAGKDDPTTWDHLGDIYFRSGDVAKAQSAWKSAAALYEQDYRSKKDGRAEELRRKLTQAVNQR